MAQLERESVKHLPPDFPAIVCFLDETGVIAQDDIFAVGVLALSEQSDLAVRVRKYRQRIGWTDEWHFTHLTTHGLGAYRGLIDVLVDCPEWMYRVTLADRTEFDVAAACGDRFLAYERIAAQSLAGIMRRSNALAGAVRVSSDCHGPMQVADVLTGGAPDA